MDSALLLNKGYIKIVETWGTDERIVETARMSTQGGFKGWGTEEAPGDEKLLRYLDANGHTSPFEFAGAVFEVRAPIMVFREWHRHRTFSYNEESARYGKLKNENFRPNAEDVMRRAEAARITRNRQAQGTSDHVLTAEELDTWLGMVDAVQAADEAAYVYALSVGVPKELARITNTVARYSTMRAQANLTNLIKFIGLRSAPNAQKEIRVYSNAMYGILRTYFPRTFTLVAERFGFAFQELS